jgi:hypothetical protein
VREAGGTRRERQRVNDRDRETERLTSRVILESIDLLRERGQHGGIGGKGLVREKLIVDEHTQRSTAVEEQAHGCEIGVGTRELRRVRRDQIHAVGGLRGRLLPVLVEAAVSLLD